MRFAEKIIFVQNICKNLFSTVVEIFALQPFALKRFPDKIKYIAFLSTCLNIAYNLILTTKNATIKASRNKNRNFLRHKTDSFRPKYGNITTTTSVGA